MTLVMDTLFTETEILVTW